MAGDTGAGSGVGMGRRLPHYAKGRVLLENCELRLMVVMVGCGY